MSRILCVSICSVNNEPLFLQNFDNTDLLQCHHLMYSSLDVVLELAKKADMIFQSRGRYLGEIFPFDDQKIYGYITPTNKKFLLMASKSIPEQQQLENFFKEFHRLYVNHISNPFIDCERKIDSPSFIEKVTALVSETNKRI
ncbi:putative Trafficking protein particle complex subunit [Blattamonas nauphoetae]|uniref:Trafficking protein particle complex subunit n=1 Tax=Blattamonas nauphoetae TaxID=2049346 RepID=A0ABQ9XI92_9EUKA|nr:putative Trafficking protein particle complex subunit [Blattamonas nauphoetae]